MPDFHDELSLLFFLILNVGVFGTAYLFSRRQVAGSFSQAVLDAALTGYAVQYISIGIPGLLGWLNTICVTSIAALCAGALLVLGFRSRPITADGILKRDCLFVAGVFAFAATFIIAFAYQQSDLPVISNDAMTYHFPAAVQWLQQKKITLYQTWFFNPSNTYSPLAGSIFILWLILPFGSEVLAKFIEVPALLCVGIAVYRLCRELDCRRSVSSLIAAAAIVCRPIFLPGMMGKDDLFVVFFLLTALAALSKQRSADRIAAIRFGIAFGLLLATKYTVLISLPILLFAIDSPRWSAKKWVIGIGVAILFAGPWYLRNMILTGNPLFPAANLFTTTRSDSFHSFKDAANTIIEGSFGIPILVAATCGVSCIGAISWAVRSPILRGCSIGAAASIAIFLWKSPFPEVRFLLPAYAAAFVTTGFYIERIFRKKWHAVSAATAVLALSVCTLFPGHFTTAVIPLASVSLFISVLTTAGTWWAYTSSHRRLILGFNGCLIFFFVAYTRWTAYCEYQRQTRFISGAGYSMEYPDLTRMWNFVDQNIPPDATVAYTNLYFVYPMQGWSLQRRMVYAPTRAGVSSIADLGWLGSNLSGEQLVPAAIRATVASPDRQVWRSNLKKSGAKFLVVGRSGSIDLPAEFGFASPDPTKFKLLFSGPSGWVYQVN